ncbi:MAG TPA: hypothetical protein VEN95_06255 [Actinomycetota bacterium]|nr:hypothetical protein [Actinomycetota bacterium]
MTPEPEQPIPPPRTAGRETTLTLNTTASFPACLASSEFSIQVLATAVV